MRRAAHRSVMAAKEGDSLLWISSADSKVPQQKGDSRIHITTIVVAIVVAWLSLLTLHNLSRLTADEAPLSLKLRADVIKRD